MPTVKNIPIDGIIGEDITARDIRAALADAGDIGLLIHSPGGSVAEGIDIYNAIRAHRRAGHVVLATVTGLAASMATAIAMAADSVAVEDNAIWMVHNPAGIAIGDHNTMRRSAETLDALSRLLAKAYAKKTGREINAIRAEMDAETWLFGDEIKAAGYADSVIPAGDGPDNAIDARAVARTKFDAMLAKLRESEPTIDQIAALLPRQPPEHQAMADQATQDPAATPEQEPLTDNDKTPPTDPAPPEPVDMQAHVQAALKAERERISAINKRCAQVGMPAIAQALIDAGADMAACNAAIVEAWIAKGGQEITQTTTQASASAPAVIDYNAIYAARRAQA